MEEITSWFRIPRTRQYSGFLAFSITAVSETAFFWFGPHLEADGLWTLLIALPVSAGLLAALLYGCSELRTYEECLRAAQWPLVWLYLILFLLAVLSMPLLAYYIWNIIYLTAVLYSAIALPFAIVLAALGGTLGYCIQRAAPRKFAETAPIRNA